MCLVFQVQIHWHCEERWEGCCRQAKHFAQCPARWIITAVRFIPPTTTTNSFQRYWSIWYQLHNWNGSLEIMLTYLPHSEENGALCCFFPLCWWNNKTNTHRGHRLLMILLAEEELRGQWHSAWRLESCLSAVFPPNCSQHTVYPAGENRFIFLLQCPRPPATK